MRFNRSAVMTVCGLALISSTAVSDPQVLRFGAPITHKTLVDFKQLTQSPATFQGKTVCLQGVVQAVCQSSGCWMQVGSPTGEAIMVKSLDGSMHLPRTCTGQNVVVQGVVTNSAKAGHHHHGKGEHACAQAQWVVSMVGVELNSKK